jgi:hypothetical protein
MFPYCSPNRYLTQRYLPKRYLPKRYLPKKYLPKKYLPKTVVAHALVRAASRLISTLVPGPFAPFRAGVGTSADAARTSACATNAYSLGEGI